MFALNFKKEWKMHKSLLLSFMIVSAVAFAIITAIYLVLKFSNVEGDLNTVLFSIWSLIASLVIALASILPIILMIKTLKGDLGKNNVHYTIFTPQSIISWYLPKVLFIFIVQGLFALINFGYLFLVFDATTPIEQGLKFEFFDHILTFLISTFSFGLFGVFTLCIALYYSFRKKGKAWSLIVLTGVLYFIGQVTYALIMTFQQIAAGNNEIVLDMTKLSLVQYGIDSSLGLIFILIALYLFDKKIEY